MVIVDGGSTDGTLEALEEADRVTVISAAGREHRRAAATSRSPPPSHDVIAVTDADCTLAPDWLERLLAPIDAGADVSAGFYRPVATAFLQEAWRPSVAPRARRGRPGLDAVLPLDRRFAAARTTRPAATPNGWRSARTCTSTTGWSSSGVRMVDATDAVVYWHIRPTLGETWTQYVRLRRGRRARRHVPRRHFLRFAVYGLGALALTSRSRFLTALAAAAGTAYASRPVRRAWTRLADRPGDRAASTIGVPAAMAFVDLAKMWGYARGLARRVTEEVFYD